MHGGQCVVHVALYDRPDLLQASWMKAVVIDRGWEKEGSNKPDVL